MPNPVGRPKGSKNKRKAHSLSSSNRASKRARTTTKVTTSTSLPPSLPTEALVPFPPDVTTGEVRLTDIVLNDDATVTCDYAFRGVGNMATYVHLGSAFVTDDDIRVKAGQWVYVKYSDTGEEDAKTAQAPAVIVHLFGYAHREFALIAWGYREDDEEIVQLSKNEQNGKDKNGKRIVPSDYLQVIECDEISTILGGCGKLPLILAGEAGGDKEYWDGHWLVKFCSNSKGAGKLWRPENLPAQQPIQDTADTLPTNSGTTEPDHSTFVDAAETLTEAAEAVSANPNSIVISHIIDSVKPATPTPKSPPKAKGRTPLKTYAKSGTPARTKG